MKLFAIALCFALVLPSCAEDKVLIISGQSMVTLADQFAATADAMDAGLESKAVNPEAHRKWKNFGVKFQEAYPLAVHLWQVAEDHHDEKLTAQVATMVAQMAVDLGAYAALVGVK